MRAAILAACLMTTGSLPVATARWSDPATWGGSVPTSGPVVIPSGQAVLLDVSTAGLGALTINGTLLADPSADVGITAANIVIGATGTLQVGSESQRYTRNCTITLTGAESGRSARFVPLHDNPTAGKGKPARLAVGTGVASGEIITLTFTSATTFTAASSVAGAMPSGTVGSYYSSRVQFMQTAGSTAWVAGDTVIISAGTQMGFTNDGIARSLQVQPGGQLKLFGAFKTGAAILNANAASGATALTLAATPTGWASGDSVVVGPTDFYETASGTPHATTLAANVSAASCALSAGLNAARWGALQYPTDTGISLSPGTFATMKASATTPTQADERARIINKTRNIVIQGADDAAWSSSKFGAHCMVMGLASVVRLDGVEFRRVGQAGAIGRYPIHWHMLSYGGQQGGDVARLPSDGTFLGAIPAGNAYLRNCSIHTTGQRGTVIHGTHGVELSNNVYHDITGHCIFLEDGAEQNNTITNNTIIGVSNPATANALLGSESNLFDVAAGGLDAAFNASAGIWFTNPRNTLTGNHVTGCAGAGIWNAFGPNPVGLCIEVPMAPDKLPLLLHSGNWSGCNAIFGMLTSQPPINTRGHIGSPKYQPLDGVGAVVSADFTDLTLFKNGRGGYHNSVWRPGYKRWTLIGNRGMDLLGAVQDTTAVEDSLFIGTSLNNATPPAVGAPYGPRAGLASYHFLLVPRNCSFYAYPLATSTVQSHLYRGSYFGGGMIRMDDLYLDAIQMGLEAATGNKLFGTAIGYRALPAPDNGSGVDMGGTLAHALYDTNGLFGLAGGNVIFDFPYLTYDLDPGAIPLAGQPGYTTPQKFCGISNLYWNNEYLDAHPHPTVGTAWLWHQATMTRLSPSTLASVGSHTINDGVLNSGSKAWAMARGGIYKVTFPAGKLPSVYTTFPISRGHEAADNFILGMPWAGATVSSMYMITAFAPITSTAPDAGYVSAGMAKSLAPVGGMAALKTATEPSYWLDSSAQTVWFRHLGNAITVRPDVGSDKSIYYRISA
jgi:hypothetical protein